MSFSNSNNIKNYKSYSSYYIKKNDLVDEKFVRWINRVEKLVFEKFNIGLLDLPDEDYMYYYENKYSSNDMFSIIQDNNSFYFN